MQDKLRIFRCDTHTACVTQDRLYCKQKTCLWVFLSLPRGGLPEFARFLWFHKRTFRTARLHFVFSLLQALSLKCFAA